MPMDYFEQRERALLGDRFDVLYVAPQETAELSSVIFLWVSPVKPSNIMTNCSLA